MLMTTMKPEQAQTALLLEQLLQIARVSALEEMASGMAHELNQPIGAITTFAQAGRRMLNRSEPMVQSTSEVLEQISRQALQAGEGIRRIRGLFDGHALGRGECDCAEVVMELLPVLNVLAERYSTHISLSLAAGLPRVSIDRLRIQHVLFTLVQNALEAPTNLDASPNVSIEVSGDRYGVKIAVQDQGKGIQENAREHLFHPFFTTKAHGTGLGLASSRAIIEAHEGSIGCESVPNTGACFWFRVPAAVQYIAETAS